MVDKMSNEMLDRIIDVIEKGGPYKFRRRETTFGGKIPYEIWRTDEEGNLIEWIKTFFTHDEVENEIEKMNNEFVAHAVVKSMRGISDDVFNNYVCDTYWKDSNSSLIWRKWIEAILK